MTTIYDLNEENVWSLFMAVVLTLIISDIYVRPLKEDLWSLIINRVVLDL